MARIMSASKPLPGTVQRAAGQLAFGNNLSPSIVSSIKFLPSIGFVTSRIEKLNLDIRSFRVPLERSIREVMVPSIRRNFDAGGRPAWEPLADGTIRARELLGFSSDNPLVRTGSLRRVASQINIWHVTIESAVIDDLPDKVFYGKIHQAGTGSPQGQSAPKITPVLKRGSVRPTREPRYYEPGYEAFLKQKKASSGISSSDDNKKRYIPARPFLIIQPEDVTAIELIFVEWLNMRIAAASWKI